MKILLVSATLPELQPLLSSYPAGENSEISIGGKTVKILITGVGMVATAFSLGRHLQDNNPYDLAVNAGIAGSFDPLIVPGSVCRVTKDIFTELGAEDGEEFLTIDDLGLGTNTFFERPSGILSPDLPEVTSITVNTVHGNDASIDAVKRRFNPQLETMEGAAFFYACHENRLPCIQLRSVSNFVERRNRDSWQIGPAINNLNETLIKLLEQ